MLILDIIAFSCPLLLCALGALYSDYAGILAIFLEGELCLCAYLMFFFTCITHTAILAVFLTVFSAVLAVFVFALIVEKLKANPFISATAINLFFGSLPSFLAAKSFKNRGVLTSPFFSFPVFQTKIITVCISILLISLGILFLKKTRSGLYIRITGSDSEVLTAKGVNSRFYRILSWLFAAFFAAFSGAFLSMRVSSFVPGISSGRGWMALAAVYLGKKNPFKITLSAIIFCTADFFAARIQNVLPSLPASVVLALPYIVILILLALEKKN